MNISLFKICILSMEILADITPITRPAGDEMESGEQRLQNMPRNANLPGQFDTHISQLREVRILGEGAFGEVKLFVDKNDPELAVAIKFVDLNRRGSEYQAVRRESLLHRFCSSSNHPNVLKHLAMQRTRDGIFLQFMEYADGGELFDQIEPDFGMPPEKARFYFRQLLEGLDHIHSKGVVHRDLKPENLLLTKRDVLKISDFGMATIFRHEGKERQLDTPCGSRPYAAPELLAQRKYWAVPIDLWSSGVVLVTLLVGELPWESPERACDRFRNWIDDNSLHHSPWNRVDTQALSLLKGILQFDPAKRMTIDRIKRHPWLINTDPHEHQKLDKFLADGPPTKMPRLLLNDENYYTTQPDSMFSLSKDGTTSGTQRLSAGQGHSGDKNPSIVSPFSFSQPAECIDSLLLSTQIGNSQPPKQTCALQKLVRRMTRLCMMGSREQAVFEIEAAFKQNGFITKQPIAGQIMATSLRGGKKAKLVIVSVVYEMTAENQGAQPRVLADFRRSRGDGLEFKRAFIALRKYLHAHICPDSNSWMVQHGLMELSLLKQLKIGNEGDDTEQTSSLSATRPL